MSQHSGNMRGEMYGETFLIDILSEEQRFARYVGRDNYFSIARVGDGTYYLRAHDEITEGGLSLTFEQSEVEPPFVAADPAELPTECASGPPAPLVQIDVDTSGGDFSIDGWAPCASIGQLFRIRKISNDGNSVIWNDPTLPGHYQFVNKAGEFMTLLWGGSSFHIV